MKLIKHFMIIMTACFVLVLVVSCEVGGKIVSQVEIDQESLPATIVIGDFDIRNGKLKVTYTDGSKEEVNVVYSMLEATDLAKFQTVGNHSIQITYLNYVLTYTFEVIAPTKEEVAEQVALVKQGIIISEVVTGDFTLVTKVGEVSISWQSSDTAITIEGGIAKVTRPVLGLNDTFVVLTATFTKYGYEFEYQYDVVVKAYTAADYQQQVDLIANAIVIPANIYDQLTLPFDVVGQPDAIINWYSNDPAIVIDNENKTVIVNQVDTQVQVTLTFTITYKGVIFDNFNSKKVVVLPPASVVKAPSPTNVKITGNTLTFTKVSGITHYHIYVDNMIVTTITTNSLNLLTLLNENKTYIIGVQSVGTGSYNLDSDVVTVSYELKTIQYDGNYYDGVDLTKTGDALWNALTTLLTQTHKYKNGKQNYDSLKTDIPITDASLTNPSKVVLIYSRIEVQGAWSSSGTIWNREHVWPQSVGWKESAQGGYDLHHLRPEDPSVNSSRGNSPFGKVSNGSLVYLSNTNGRVSSNCYSGGGYFEPQDVAKGDVARILLYMMVRYKSQVPSGGITLVTSSMTLLLEWNTIDPVDEWEMRRNEETFKIQGNRNPFIDYSYLANQIWG